MERKPLSIREFAELCGVSHTEISRKMKTLAIEGTPGGKGKPTLLSTAEQDAIAQVLFVPAPPTAPTVNPAPQATGGLSIYQPAPLATTVNNADGQRYRGRMSLTASVAQGQQNLNSLRDALLQASAEDGAQLGYEMAQATISEAVRVRNELLGDLGKGMGVVSDA